MPNPAWQTLKKRAQLLQQLRAFFYTRGITEVDVPALNLAPAVDAHIDPVTAKLNLPGHKEPLTTYLHTSPELALKQLISQGAEDLFYLGKVYRDGDLSPIHKPEFTMLEWYRIGWSLDQLIDEVVTLIQTVMPQTLSVEKLTYQQAFQIGAQIEDIHHATAQQCQEKLKQLSGIEVAGVNENDKVLWEQLLLTEVI
jgi:lysyl-tRNA synthetase class 2